MRPTFAAIAIVVVALAGAGLNTAAQTPSQDPPLAVPPVSMLRGGELGELLEIYVPLPDEELQRRLEVARNLSLTTDNEIAHMQRLATMGRGRIDILDEEIATTKVRRDVAKKTNDPAFAELEGTLARQEAEAKYLSKILKAMNADTERAKSENESAIAWSKALELEQKVALRFLELSNGTPTGAEIEDYRSNLKVMLEAQRDVASSNRDRSEMRRKLADARLQQLKAFGTLSK